jgi:hypothetical protein
MRNISVALSMLVLSSACVESAEFGAGAVAMREVHVNATVLQGPGLIVQGPGLVVQGPGLVVQGPGLVVQGISLNGPGLVVQGPGLVVQGMHLEGSLLSAVVQKDGVDYPIAGLDFIGAEIDLRLTVLADGQLIVSDLVLRIDNIAQSPIQPDIYLYDLSYREKTSDVWLPYCGSPGVTALPLENYWDQQSGDRIDDDNVITFACSNAVLAKCALWGYRPWATADSCEGKKKKEVCSEISLQDHHQACTRMARADYCGDGHAATVDGTLIDIWDGLQDPMQTPFTDWPVEAEWGPDGATCLNFTRHPEFDYPACFTKKNGKPVKAKGCEGELDGDALLGSAFSEPL